MSLYKVTAFSLHHNGAVRNLGLTPTGSLRYEEQLVYNSTCKFGYEESVDNPGLFHLRCLHNNKYLVRSCSSSAQPKLITATACKPEEDKSKEGCTLFRLDFCCNKIMKWFHIQTKQFVCMYAAADASLGYYLCIGPESTDQVVVECIPIDVERVIKLPSTVVFKGDNGKYLMCDKVFNTLVFSGEDRYRKEAWYEVFPLSNGDVRIKSVRNGMFWRLNADTKWIVADSTDSCSNDPKTVFLVTRLCDDSIALISRGNNQFCQRSVLNQLYAEVDSGVKEAWLLVEEPLVSRNIEIEYRLNDALIYGQQSRSWLSQVAFNDATESLQATLSITYTEALRCSFNVTTSVSTNISAVATFEASIPFVAYASAKQKVETEMSVETSFGKTIDKSEQFQFTTTIIVPPKEKRRAIVQAFEAKCHVPFSYVLTDVQADNTVVRTNLQDGVYRGMNGYDFCVHVFDPDKTNPAIFDEPVNTHVSSDTLARQKIYFRKN